MIIPDDMEFHVLGKDTIREGGNEQHAEVNFGTAQVPEIPTNKWEEIQPHWNSYGKKKRPGEPECPGRSLRRREQACRPMR